MKPFLEYSLPGELCSRYHWVEIGQTVDMSAIAATMGICVTGENHIVLTRHHRRGWELPGGRTEAGETPEQTLMREIREETGGDIIDPQPIALITWDHHDTDIVHYGILYTGGWESKGYSLVDDAIDAACIPLSQLDTYLTSDTLHGRSCLTLVKLFAS